MFEDRPPIRPREREDVALREGAMRDLTFIRDTLERTVSFTGVSGWGGVSIGLLALVAAAVASTQPNSRLWLWTWVATAIFALGIAIVAISRKARRMGVPLSSGAGRKFAVGMAPALVSGSVLTVVFYMHGIAGQLPGVWLLLYGSGVLAAGVTSVRVIRLMGICFMVLGTAAFLLPTDWGDALMALGFGALHILFGIIIIRDYGG